MTSQTRSATRTYDDTMAEEFGGRLMGVLDATSLALLLSVGHRTGLLDVLGDLDAPASSEQIARAAVLDERYVREWLGGLVVAEVVTYDPRSQTYQLPPAHAASLTTAAGPDNLAFYMQYAGLLGTVEPEIVRVFRDGGGVPYEQFDTFQQLQRDETARVFDVALVETILPLADGVVDRLRGGIDVLDVGTGGGHAVNVMARAFPASRFTGLDISAEGIGMARTEAEQWGLGNARFAVGDAAAVSGSYDLITAFDTIHDQARPAQVLAAVAGALAEGGTFLMGDIECSSNLEENVGQPAATLIFALSVFHCMTVSLAYGGAGLGTAWGRQRAQQMLAEAGFASIETRSVADDPLNVYYVAHRG